MEGSGFGDVGESGDVMRGNGFGEGGVCGG